MRSYHQLTPRDRCHIEHYLQVGSKVFDIAKFLGVHRSTIYRELRRNRRGSYKAKRADDLAMERCYRQPYKITQGIENAVLVGLTSGYSPEQIAGRLRYLGIPLSHQSVYDYVYRHSLAYYLPRYGKRGGGRYLQRQARYRHKRMIHERPKVVKKRSRLGDWERDGMYMANKQQLLVCTERKSRFLVLGKMPSISPPQVSELTQQLLDKYLVHTLTNDNGPEFRDSHNLPYDTYHCYPRKPQQRGTVENTIGRLRRYIPKKMDPNNVSEPWLKQLASCFNHTPRKCLNYRTPHELMHHQQSVALAIRI